MEKKLAVMLKEKRGQFMESNDIVPFTKILMKMTKMAQVLKHIHTVFQQVDLDGNGTLELDELQTLMTKIGCDLPPDGLNLMFECADLEHVRWRRARARARCASSRDARPSAPPRRFLSRRGATRRALIRARAPRASSRLSGEQVDRTRVCGVARHRVSHEGDPGVREEAV